MVCRSLDVNEHVLCIPTFHLQPSRITSWTDHRLFRSVEASSIPRTISLIPARCEEQVTNSSASAGPGLRIPFHNWAGNFETSPSHSLPNALMHQLRIPSNSTCQMDMRVWVQSMLSAWWTLRIDIIWNLQPRIPYNRFLSAFRFNLQLPFSTLHSAIKPLRTPSSNQFTLKTVSHHA